MYKRQVEPKDIAQTAQALKAAFIEVRRAADFGFTPTEYERYKANRLSALDKAYSNKDKRPNRQFFHECLGHFLNNEPMPPIEYTYETMKMIIPAIPLETVNQALRELIPANDSNMVIVSFNNEKEGNVYPTEAGLLGAVKEARATKIDAYVDNVKNEPLIKTLPKAGTIKSEKKNTKLGYTELKLSNGATVILKKTDYKKDQVILSGAGYGGNSLYGAKDYKNLQMFDQAIGISLSLIHISEPTRH